MPHPPCGTCIRTDISFACMHATRPEHFCQLPRLHLPRHYPFVLLTGHIHSVMSCNPTSMIKPRLILALPLVPVLLHWLKLPLIMQAAASCRLLNTKCQHCAAQAMQQAPQPGPLTQNSAILRPGSYQAPATDACSPAVCCCLNGLQAQAVSQALPPSPDQCPVQGLLSHREPRQTALAAWCCGRSTAAWQPCLVPVSCMATG